MHRRMAVIALGLGSLIPQPVLAQTDASTVDWSDARFAARFEAFDWLIGEWQGYGQFSDRTGYIHKRYSYDVAGMYFVERTLDMFPPPQPSTEFEVHQDFTVFFRDNLTGALSANGYYVESFVTDAAVTVAGGGDTFVVESRTIHNGPPGMRTRFTYTRTGEDDFTLHFELAGPAEEYSEIEVSRFRRIR